MEPGSLVIDPPHEYRLHQSPARQVQHKPHSHKEPGAMDRVDPYCRLVDRLTRDVTRLARRTRHRRWRPSVVRVHARCSYDCDRDDVAGAELKKHLTIEGHVEHHLAFAQCSTHDFEERAFIEVDHTLPKPDLRYEQPHASNPDTSQHEGTHLA